MGVFLGVELLDRTSVFNREELPNCFPVWVCHFTFTSAVLEGSNLFSFSPALVIVSLFDCSHPGEYEVGDLIVVYSCVCIMMRLNIFSCTYDAKLWEVVKDRGAWASTVHGVTKDRIRLSNWTTAWRNVCSNPLPILNWVICLLLLSCKTSLYILDVTPYRIHKLLIFSPILVFTSLFSWLLMKGQHFNFDKEFSLSAP